MERYEVVAFVAAILAAGGAKGSLSESVEAAEKIVDYAKTGQFRVSHGEPSITPLS